MTEIGKTQQNMTRKSYFKPHWAIFLVVAILCIVPISAEVFTFDNVKQYDKETKTITIKNIFGLGKDISTIQLNTPLNYHVGAGYQKVAEFEIDLFDDGYSNAFKKMEFFDLNNDWNEINRDFDYKYLTTELVEVNDYEDVCSLSLNGTKSCSYEVVGTHKEEKEVWKDLDIKTLKKGKVIVGIFTEVQINDYVEWIPTLFGKEIDEWASWSSSLNVKHMAYYDMETGTGTNIVDRVDGDNDATLQGSGTFSSTKKLGSYSTTYQSNGDYATTNINMKSYDWTWSGWVKFDALPNENNAPIIGGTDDQTLSIGTGWVDGASLSIHAGNGASWSCGDITGATTLSVDTWYHIVAMRDGNNVSIFLNSAHEISCNSYSGAFDFNLNIGRGGASYMDGFIDELSYWNRTLTSAEIVNLYNGGSGMAYSADSSPIVTLNSPIDTYNSTSKTITFNATLSDDINLMNGSLYLNGIINETNSSGFNGTYYIFDKTFNDGDYNWTIEAFDNNSKSTTATTRTFSVDTISPVTKIIYPTGTIIYHKQNTNLSLNWSVNDTNLDSCWYNWNGTNTSVTCSDNQTNINITDGRNKVLTFYANDTSGLLNSSIVTWNYQLFLKEETYDVENYEGLSSTFSATFITNGSDITSASLRYNNTNNVGTISNHGVNNFTVTETIIAPAVSADTNKSFYWMLTQGSLEYNVTSQNQTVLNLGIDDCSTHNSTFYNFTIRNEENLSKLTSTTARLNLQIYGYATSNLIQSYNKTYTSVNPFTVCLNNNLSTGGQFSYDMQVQYKATGYVQKLYHIQNETANSTNFLNEIDLYDLNETDSQVFKIIFRDSSFLPVEDALIKVYRKYVDENAYKIVEIPITDKRGETLAHLVLNEVVYNFEVVKYGVILETFTDVIAICQTPLVASCEIDLNAFSETIVVPDYEEAEDFSFTLGYDNDTRIITSIFNVPSGTIQTITLNVTTTDSLGTEICTDSLLSSSGTLSCVVPSTFGNSTMSAKLYKAGNLQGQGQVKLDQNPKDIYGVSVVFLALFVMITLIGAGASDNPIFTVIFLMVGVGLLFALNLVANEGFIGATATILFFVMAVIIVIIKGSRRT